jgi:hypothetical protein
MIGPARRDKRDTRWQHNLGECDRAIDVAHLR